MLIFFYKTLKSIGLKLGVLFFSLFLGVMIAGSQPVSAQAITINFDENYAPYMVGDVIHAKGLYPELVKAIFNRADIPVRMQALPWRRALALADKAQAGIGGLYMNDKRLAKYDFSKALYTESLSVYVANGADFKYTNVQSLKDKVIGLIAGWSYGNILDHARREKLFTPHEVKNNKMSLTLVSKKRIDASIIDQLSASIAIRNHALENKVKMLSPPVTRNQAFIAFHKKSDQTELLKLFNKTLLAMQNDKSYDKLISNFIKKASN